MPSTFVALAPSAATADIKRHSSIPDAYLGTWAPGAGTCGDSDKTAVVLSAKAYASSGANCTVDYVSETAGARGAIYSARMQCSNPASKAQKKSALNVIIRPEGADRIMMGPGFDKLTAYQRCSSGPAANQ